MKLNYDTFCLAILATVGILVILMPLKMWFSEDFFGMALVTFGTTLVTYAVSKYSACKKKEES
jgi:hypothetical protein